MIRLPSFVTALYRRSWLLALTVAVAEVLLVAVVSPMTLAQAPAPPPAPDGAAPVQIPDPLGGVKDPRDLLGRIIGASLGIVGSIALLFFLWGGFLWMTSGGNAERVETGKRTIMWATLGLAIIFLAYAIIKTVLCILTGSCGEGGVSRTSDANVSRTGVP